MADPRGRKHELPVAFRCRIWVLPLERRGKNHAAKASQEVTLMLTPHALEMLGEARFDRSREHGSTILLPFPRLTTI
jgi:hypothetical protein